MRGRIYNKDFDQYFVEKINQNINPDKMYDLFFETYPSPLKNKLGEASLKQKYIWQLGILFRKIFKYNPETNKVEDNEYFKNLRLHYIDIRDYFFGENMIYYLINSVSNDLINWLSEDVNNEKYNSVMIRIDQIKTHTKLLLYAMTTYDLYKQSNTKNKIINDEPSNVDMLKYFMIKLTKKYKNETVRKFIVDKINDLLNRTINNLKELDDLQSEIIRVYPLIETSTIFKLRTNFIYNKKQYGISFVEKNIYMQKIFPMCSSYLEHMMNIYVELIDLFCLRRILDKDYVTNSIVYTGAAHSFNYLSYLVKYFGFKVTHYSFSSELDINKLNEKIIQSQNYNDISTLFDKPELIQCSNLTSFPDNFN